MCNIPQLPHCRYNQHAMSPTRNWSVPGVKATWIHGSHTPWCGPQGQNYTLDISTKFAHRLIPFEYYCQHLRIQNASFPRRIKMCSSKGIKQCFPVFRWNSTLDNILSGTFKQNLLNTKTQLKKICSWYVIKKITENCVVIPMRSPPPPPPPQKKKNVHR